MLCHVTIDLDYFLYGYADSKIYPERVNICDNILSYLMERDKPVKVFKEHHHILPFINEKKYDFIINIDYHSDICRMTEALSSGIEEGTWANFYKYRESSIFYWMYPSKYESYIQGYGRCDSMPLPCKANGYSEEHHPPLPISEMGWKSIIHREGIDMRYVKGADSFSIVLSEEWCDPSMFSFFNEKYSLKDKVEYYVSNGS